MGENTNRSEAERLLGISEKLLESRDLNGSKEFAILAQETEPLLEGTDQILAVVDVLLASSSENRVSSNQPNWYKILQIEDPDQSPADLIKKQYRRLALLLHPDKNRLPYADQAFRLVADAWEVLSTAAKKSQFDLVFTKVDLNRNKKKGAGTRSGERMSTFWTACPYCYALHEYPRVYLEYCIRCQNCQRAFHAASVPQLPPLVPGRDEYYCCWGFFPMGFVGGEASKFPEWMPPVFGQNNGGGVAAAPTEPNGAGSSRGVPISFDGWSSGSGKRDGEAVRSENGGVVSDGMPKKRGRGRPKKNV